MSGALYLFLFDFPFIVDYNVDERTDCGCLLGCFEVAHLVLLVGEKRPRAFHRDSECKRE
jgi:hypothetical protein